MFLRPVILFAALSLPVAAVAQYAATSTGTAIPHVVKYTVALPPGAEATVRVALYAAPEGGEQLWAETQRVTPDPSGKTVLLVGSATEGGIPQSVFAAAEARYVGIAVESAPEQPRTLLVPAAYALKAVDADTLGGHPVTDFAMAGKLKPDGSVDITQINTSSGILGAGTGPTVSLTADPAYFNTYYGQLAAANAFTASNSFSKPIVSTVATGTAPFTIASTTAVPNLDASLLGGAAAAAFPQLTLQNTFTNNQIIGPSAPATTSTGHSSYFLWMNASVWNSTRNAAQNIGFQWRAEPLSNDTASPNANFALLSTVTSATPQETGFKITANGIVTFVAGQTFPGTGTITGVTAGSGLTGGGTTGSVSLGIDPAYTNTLATLSGANYFTNINTFAAPITSVVQTGAAPFSVASTTVVPNLNASYVGGIAATNIATLSGGNQFTASQELEPTATATSSAGYASNTLLLAASAYNSSSSAAQKDVFVWQAEPTGNDTSSPGATLDLQYTDGSTRPVETGFSFGENGIVTFAAGQTFPGTITGVTAGTGLTGGGTSGAVTLNVNPTYLNANYASLTAANTFSGAQTINSTVTISGSASTQLSATSSAYSGTGVYGSAATGYGVHGDASGPGGIGVRATAEGSSGVGLDALALSAGGIGIYAGGGSIGGQFTGNMNGGIGVNGVYIGENTNGYGIFGQYGYTTAVGKNELAAGYSAGVWADAANPSGSNSTVALLATADAMNAISAFDNSPYDTIYASNAGAGNTIYAVDSNTGDANATLHASNSGTGLIAYFGSSAGSCDVDHGGDINCTGNITANASVGSDNAFPRMVQTTALMGARAWVEDIGSADLTDGRTMVVLHPDFTKVANAEVEYQVFLTPGGECEGLYVAHQTATGFEVHELHHGHSSLRFHYRIVAEKRGSEGVYLADVTEKVKQRNTAEAGHHSIVPAAAVKK